MMKLLTILLIISVQSFGQTPVVKEIKIAIDSPKYVMKAKYENKTMDIEVTYGNVDTSVTYTLPDTIWTNRILRFQTNNNSSLLMTKVKYLVRRIVNGKEVWEADDRKVYDIFQYYSTVYNTWTQL